MYRIFFVIIFLSTLTAADGQFNESEILYRAKTIYHSLRLSGLDNFSGWVTSNNFIERTDNIFNQEVYPFEIIWKNPNIF